MWWLVWIVRMVLVPALDGLHVIRQMRALAQEPAEADARLLGSDH